MRMAHAAAVAVAVAACGGADLTDAWRAEVRDSAGVVLVSNSATGAWVVDRPWTVEPDLTIGVASGDPDQEFGQITGLDVGADGSIYILDRQASHLRVYDSTGQLTRTIGGPGEGPGELSIYASTVLIGRADTILVPDLQRINVYLRSGEVLPSIPARSLGAIGWGIRGDGDLLYRRFSREWDGLIVYRGPDATPDTVLRFEYPEIDLQVSEDPVSGSMRASFDPFPPIPHWAVLSDGHIVVGHTGLYRLLLYGSDGTLERAVTRSGQRRALAPSAERAINELEAERQRARGVSAEVANSITLLMPDSLPTFTNLAAGPEGTFWVQQLAEIEDFDPASLGALSYEGLGSRIWDVFDRDGQYLGEVSFPSQIRLLRYRGGSFYGVERGAFDVERVVRLRLNR